ncbi:hypothetical protein [Aquimarina amphilecti]|uniref:hypothetical protein n=1 Tax=Aquimarina amphilecti TaxID=1038014 RepID=UPI001480975B|nr:hypothetical protein [Aquimarina amphilecti]
MMISERVKETCHVRLRPFMSLGGLEKKRYKISCCGIFLFIANFGSICGYGY